LNGEIRKRLDLTFYTEQWKFLNWLADQDNVSVRQELNMIFWNQFDFLMNESYKSEYEQDNFCKS